MTARARTHTLAHTQCSMTSPLCVYSLHPKCSDPSPKYFVLVERETDGLAQTSNYDHPGCHIGVNQAAPVEEQSFCPNLFSYCSTVYILLCPEYPEGPPSTRRKNTVLDCWTFRISTCTILKVFTSNTCDFVVYSVMRQCSRRVCYMNSY